ncbi:MAG: tetratricopeptide repeat protein [Pyrinomonadaceae bacterium]
MSLQLNISAGEFFDLIRPVALVLSALASIWVLVSARQRQFSLFHATAWALGTLFFPLIVLPLYLVIRFVRKRRGSNAEGENRGSNVSSLVPKWRISVPLAYAAVVLSSIALYLHWDYQSIDAHLARAAHAKISGQPGRTIDEYRAALSKEDNPHTHKLLAIELVETGDWSGALTEFRMAEEGGETDDLIAFRIATLLDLINHPNEARLEYQKFLQTRTCTQPLPDSFCATARARVAFDVNTTRQQQNHLR